MAIGTCRKCGNHSYVMPMHGERGGPVICPLCMGAENARQANKAKAARLLFRAVDMYLTHGGRNKEIDLIVNAGALARLGGSGLLHGLGVKVDDAAPEMTKELLLQTIQLTHPDRHPPERQDMAREVTQRLTAMEPFVLPEEKERPAPKQPTPQPARSPSNLDGVLKELASYPCMDCKLLAPYYYCDACATEYKRRKEEQKERARKKQRKQYARRRQRTAWRRQRECQACGATFDPARADARYCSNACRQRAHRQRRGRPVTAHDDQTPNLP